MCTRGGAILGLGASDSPRLDIDFIKVWEEAKVRWLRPNEIYDILCNYRCFKILLEPPNLPPSGTLILFDRKILRNFRRDGHSWRKKKDNKTVKEAHEHLKVGSEEKIHVYYAHGDNDSNFQRRVYWLLDKALEHIVLVHYLQVKEGNRVNVRPGHGSAQGATEYSCQAGQLVMAGISSLSPGSSECLSSALPVEFTEHDSNDDFDTFSLEELKSSVVVGEPGIGDLSNSTEIGQVQLASYPVNSVGFANSYMSNHLSDLQPMPCISSSSIQYPGGPGTFLSHIPGFPGMKGLTEGKDNFVYSEESRIQEINTLPWEDLVAENNGSVDEGSNQDGNVSSHIVMPVVNGSAQGLLKTFPEFLPAGKKDGPSTTGFIPDCFANKMVGECEFPVTFQSGHESSDYQRSQQWQQWQSNTNISSQTLQGMLQSNENSQMPLLQSMLDGHILHSVDDGVFLKNLESMDSLQRWMLQEFPSDDQSSYLAISTDSTGYCDTIMRDEGQSMSDGASRLAQHQVAEESTVSVCKQFLFNITEFSPTWGFSSEETKVVVTGIFLGNIIDFKKYRWCCIFGDIKVPAEIVQIGVLKCKAPPSIAGHVPFFITCGDKQACSEIREFEYKTDLNNLLESHVSQFGEDEIDLKIRFARLLFSNPEDTAMSCDKMANGAMNLQASLKSILLVHDEEWAAMENHMIGLYKDPVEVMEHLLQILFKHKLKDLLLGKVQTGGKGLFSLDNHGQGVLHLASALGYDWAIAPALAAGISTNFRDKNGWTALHWAAAYGREKMVVALLAAGANSRLVSDPTPTCPSGLTPADVASHADHDGIAAYLSESDLMTHLSSLTLSENERDKQAAAEEGRRVVEYLKQSTSLRRTVKTSEDELSLNDSLSAIRNATEASVRIQAAFREYSLRERLRSVEEVDEFGFTQEETKAFLAAKKIQKAYKKHQERKLQESAALQIQNKFRGWKGRKDFLYLKQKAIQIQAYFRMHRARKQYHKILWSVGVLEKAVLRWRQKRKGLRGFHAEPNIPFEGNGGEDFLKIGRRQAEESLERSVIRVQAMVRSHQARQQYRRMLETFKQAKADLELQGTALQECIFDRVDCGT